MPDEKALDPLLGLCQDIHRQVLTQREFLLAGNLQAMEVYAASVDSLTGTLPALLVRTETLAEPVRAEAVATLQEAIRMHEENLVVLEEAAAALRKTLIAERNQATGVNQYAQHQKRPPG